MIDYLLMRKEKTLDASTMPSIGDGIGQEIAVSWRAVSLASHIID
jgi:hypothetical protein